MASSILYPTDTSTLSWWDEQKDGSSPLAATLSLNPSPLQVPSASTPPSHMYLDSSVEPLHSCGPLCDFAKCAVTSSTALLDTDGDGPPGDSVNFVDNVDLLEVKTEDEKRQSTTASEVLPELMIMDLEGDKPSYLGQQQETLVQLRRSGLVRRHAERLEKLSGFSRESLLSLKALNECQGTKRSHQEEEEELNSFTRDSTPGQVRFEPLVMPLANEALFGVVGSGLLDPTSSPHGSTLTRSSSSDSLRSVRGKPGLVRQRAQEIETRMRLAGLTVPSRLKRSNSLAKLGSLTFSSEDLCSACSSDAGTLLLLSLSPELDPSPEWHSPTTSDHLRPGKDLHTPERALPWEARS